MKSYFASQNTNDTFLYNTASKTAEILHGYGDFTVHVTGATEVQIYEKCPNITKDKIAKKIILF